VTTDAAGEARAVFLEPSLVSSQLPPPPDSLISIKTGPTILPRKINFQHLRNRKPKTEGFSNKPSGVFCLSIDFFGFYSKFNF
jgi:hypothetical protein